MFIFLPRSAQSSQLTSNLTTFSSVASGAAGTPFGWTTPSNAQLDDASYATGSTTISSQGSNYLQGLDLVSKVPSYATRILSITASILVAKDFNDAGQSFASIWNLIKGGSIIHQDATGSFSTDPIINGVFNLYSRTFSLPNFTPTELNASDSGISVATFRNTGTGNITHQIDQIKISVIYEF